MTRVHGTRTALTLVLALIIGSSSGALAFRIHPPRHHEVRVAVTPQNLGRMLEACSPLFGCRGTFVSTAFDKVDGRYLVTSSERFLLPGHAVPVACDLHDERRLQKLPRGQWIQVFVDPATAVVQRVDCIYRR
jgi:hypothetical protein